METKINQLFFGNRSASELVAEFGSPLYVYEIETIRRKFRELATTIPYEPLHIHYACKANTHDGILRVLKSEGARIEAVSIGEVQRAMDAGFVADEIIFTCSNLTVAELHWLVDHLIRVNLDSLGQLETWGRLKPGSKVSIRLNQGIGAGHHDHVITGGPDSKFGIDISQIDDAKKIALEHNLHIAGIHQHIGSNILDPEIFMRAIETLLVTARQFPGLDYIDCGGGFGVPYRPDEHALNMTLLGARIGAALNAFAGEYGSRPEIIFEAGRYIVCESGTLLVSVTDIKKTPYKTFVGVNSGFNHLVRPAMYGSYHPIINASRVSGPEAVVTIAGNVCESGDLFARDRSLPISEVGDVLAILNAGAYGFSMASAYNSRALPKEILID